MRWTDMNDDYREKIVLRLRKEGLTKEHICSRLRVPGSTLNNFLRRRKISLAESKVAAIRNDTTADVAKGWWWDSDSDLYRNFIMSQDMAFQSRMREVGYERTVD